MSDQSLKDEIIQRLKACRYDGNIIPETNEKTPDIIACGNGESYIFEIKEKISPAGFRADDVINTFGLCRLNRISGVIKDAAKQLKAFNHDQAFRLLWIVADRYWAEETYDQFHASAYGFRFLAGNRKGSGILKPAYYVENSDFSAKGMCWMELWWAALWQGFFLMTIALDTQNLEIATLGMSLANMFAIR